MVAAAADGLCQTYNAAVEAAGPLPIDNFDPSDPDPEQLPAVANHFQPVLQAGDTLVAGLRAVQGGTDGDRRQLEALATALETENANAKTQAAAALQRDATGFVATLARTDELRAVRVEAANTLGATSCAKY
jgi:hypothetical protein